MGYDPGNSTNSNGYTFYVIGVDRITTDRLQLVHYLTGLIFGKADDLWTGYQNKVSAFVNNHSGSASVSQSLDIAVLYNRAYSLVSGRVETALMSNRTLGFRSTSQIIFINN